jgi:hypothetical protein
LKAGDLDDDPAAVGPALVFGGLDPRFSTSG